MFNYQSIANSHPRLANGEVFCRHCGKGKSVDPAHSLQYGWPKCCGYTMTIDLPEDWSGKALQLVLTGDWYHKISEGSKREEYRAITPYWWKRIFTSPWIEKPLSGGYNGRFRYVRFRLGYAKDAPSMVWKAGHYMIGTPKPNWCPPDTGRSIIIPLVKRIC